MPKAAMNKEGNHPPWEYKVWIAGQLAPLEAVPESKSMGGTPDSQFGARVTAADLRHSGASFKRRQCVHPNTHSSE